MYVLIVCMLYLHKCVVLWRCIMCHVSCVLHLSVYELLPTAHVHYHCVTGIKG